MKRVLVISYYWPPSGGSGVQRWVKMCKYLPSCGWQCVVYTPLNPALTARDETLAADIPSDVEVLRRPILEPGQFARKATGSQVTPINSQKKSLKQRIAMWIRGNCFIPDPRVLWVGPSVAYLKRYLSEHPVDAIVSTGPPHSMHLIALRLSRATGIPWVADFRDPWTKMFYFKHLSLGKWSLRRHEALERKVLDGASAVVAVSPLVADDFRGMTATPVKLITNGFDPDDFAGEASAEPSITPDTKRGGADALPGRFTLLHAGLFAADGNPESLWQAIAQLRAENPDFARDFRLVLCGKTDRQVLASIGAAGLGDCLTDLGYLDHTSVVARMQKASVLMLPLRKEPEYKATLPGKLFEYLASRRPVIGIGQKDGAMAAILHETGNGTTFEWNETAAMKEWLLENFQRWQSGSLGSVASDISKYSRKSLAAAYAALLNTL